MQTRLHPKLESLANCSSVQLKLFFELNGFDKINKTPRNKASKNVTAKKIRKSNPEYSLLKNEIQQFQAKLVKNAKMMMTDYEAFAWKEKKQKGTEKIWENMDNSVILNIRKKSKFPKQNQVQSLAFPILSYTTKTLVEITSNNLMSNQFCREKYDKDTIENLVEKISQEYNLVPYHNFSHAFSLLNLFSIVEKQSEFQFSKHFSSFEFFIIKIAALAHDIGHQGVNQAYQVKRQSLLAKMHQNTSVLENMHISKFFSLLRRNSEINIFDEIKDQFSKQKSKKLVVSLILGTDSSKHFQKVGKLQQKIQTNTFNFENGEDKQLMLQLVFHACDIGNPCLDFQQYMNWSVLLSYEFNEQALKEEKIQVQPTPFLKYQNLESFYKGQIGFINVFCLPLWKQISNVCPSLEFLHENIQQNIKKVEEKMYIIAN